MPEEGGSNPPPRNTDSESLDNPPRADLPEQSVVGNTTRTHSDQEQKDSESPSGRVHWINYATFYLSVILAALTAGTIVVYYLQLQQMIVATKATQESAYDACMSSKIAQQTLLEYQAGEADSHSAASGTVAQASAVIRGESGFLAMTVGHAYTPQGGSPPSPKDWEKLDLSFTYSNIGKSPVRNAHIRFTVQILPRDTEPRPNDRRVYSDSVYGGIVNPGELSFMRPNMIDKDNKFIKPEDVNIEDFRSGKIYVASFGRADYTDVFGVSHWQTYCGFFDNSPADPSHPKVKHPNCAAYNHQDANLLYPLPRYSESKAPALQPQEIVCEAPKNSR